MDRSYYEFSEDAKRRFNDRLRWILVGVGIVWEGEEEAVNEMVVPPDRIRAILEDFYSKAAQCYKDLADDQEFARDRIAMLRDLVEQELERGQMVTLPAVQQLVNRGVKLIWEAINKNESDVDDQPLFQLLINLSYITTRIKTLIDHVRVENAQRVLEEQITKYVEKGEFDDYYIHKLMDGILHQATTWTEFRRMIDITLKYIEPSASPEPPVLEQ